jgi:hypothetical protein
MMENKQRFILLLNSTNRDGIGNLLNWLETTDFYEAPASTRFHGSYKGGLLQHSLNVYDELKRLLSAYPEIETSEDSIIIAALLHDLCKVNMYDVEQRNRKVNGAWESYDCFVHNEKFCYGGHGSKSVYIARNFIRLAPEEAVAINCHMGSWEDGAARYVGKAFEQYPLAWAVHVADESATYFKECVNNT